MMRRSLNVRRALAGVVAGSFLWQMSPAALADGAFDQGLRFFNQRNYKAAAAYFESSLRNSPWDSNAYYYAALCAHYMSNFDRAKQLYRQTLERFPGTQAASLSTAALRRIDPNFFSRRSAGDGSGATTAEPPGTQGGDVAGDAATLPARDRIYYTPLQEHREVQGTGFIVDAEVNNRRIKMLFDTGAEVCALGKNHLQQLGISPPTGSPTGTVQGIGSSKGIPTWNMTVEIKVGNIRRKSFPVVVQESLDGDPLLGQTFFRDFIYTIDPGSKSIEFVRRGGATGSASSGSAIQRDPNAVPFRLEGKEIVVDVEVNGRKCSMIFDTGASGGISMTKSAMKQLGLEVPEEAEEGTAIGVGGATSEQRFTVSSVRMGPIRQSDFPVSLPEKQAAGRPLLGQEFYKGYQYTIDYDNKVIRFVRR